ncbi:MAG: helix-turn-helix domain-containing protein, partial [Acidobacteriota bacterium]|nr:helix-turn-helix domain-containing protein [Acidobacteriota bacterium]
AGTQAAAARTHGTHAADAHDDAPEAGDARQEEEPLISLSELEGRHIARVLAHTGGNKQAAARLLGIDRTTLQRMIKRHGLDLDSLRSNGGDKPSVQN